MIDHVDRLQSLLVEENGDNDDQMDTDSEGDEAFFDFDQLYSVSETINMSELTVHERSFLHLQSFGLGDQLIEPPPLNPSDKEFNGTTVHLENGQISASTTNCRDTILLNGASSIVTFPKTAHVSPLHNEAAIAAQNYGVTTSSSMNRSGAEQPTELGRIIGAMTADLIVVNDVNNRRAAFLQKVSSAQCMPLDEQKRKTDQDASVIGKYQALLKKTKEMSAKNGKMAKRDDSLALPW